MKQILLFGAGKSATVLIDYLLSNAASEGWELVVADANLQLANEKIGGAAAGKAVSFDINDDEKRRSLVKATNLVISMLPPGLHNLVARDCLASGKHLLTASYVDDEMRNLAAKIRDREIMFLCEMGLDPGIDHMSAMRIIDHIHSDGGNITVFRSHCGGLVAPESDDNPWHYKISWNPRNIITAGKAGAVLKEKGVTRTLPYASLFENNDTVNIPELGNFAYYPNRDSLSYIPLYGLQETSTFVRTTLRHPDFCRGWNYIIKAGLTDEGPVIKSGERLSFKRWLDNAVIAKKGKNDFAAFMDDCVKDLDNNLVHKLFGYLGLLSDDPIPPGAKSNADVLQYAVEKKLSLSPADKDMIVMLHEFEFNRKGKRSVLNSSLVVKGDNYLRTAMAKTVGLPLGIAAKLLLNNTIRLRGLHIPVAREIYQPVLQELEKYNIIFNESNHEVPDQTGRSESKAAG